MRLLKVEIENILSIQNAEISFGETGLVLVEGYDHDTSRANGAGKSAIFNAISFALYDKIPRRISKSEILRKGAKEGYCCVTVGVNDRSFKVKRARPAAVEFYIDDIKVDMTQEEFEINIKLNYEQFILTMYNPQDSAERFLTLNDADKKNFLLKIMNLNKFNDAKETVSSKLKELEQNKNIIKSKIDSYNSNLDIYSQSLVSIDSINSSILQLDKDIQAYVKEIKQLELVKEPDLSKYAETENKIQEKLSILAAANATRNEDMKRYNQLQTSLRPFNPKQPDAICPACSAELNIQGKTLAKADDIEALKAQWELHQTEIKIQLEEIKSNIDKHDRTLSKKEEIRLLVEKLKLKKQEEYKDYRDAQNSIAEYKNSIALKRLETSNLKSQIEKNEDINDKITDIVKKVSALNVKLEELHTEELVLGAVEHIFDSTGAPAYIIDCIVDLINEIISSDIIDVWPNASYSIKTFKENKDKSLKAKISETFTVDGSERSIGSLSGGEFRALSLIVDFAIIQVLSSHYSIDVNPVVLDEPFDGLDLLGRELIIDILAKLSVNRQIWVIDHASESKSLFNQVIRVEKRGGISSLNSQ
jgi:DNA repair exonuclease SbcCD ATPase subunit